MGRKNLWLTEGRISGRVSLKARIILAPDWTGRYFCIFFFLLNRKMHSLSSLLCVFLRKVGFTSPQVPIKGEVNLMSPLSRIKGEVKFYTIYRATFLQRWSEIL